MSDLISRQAALDVLDDFQSNIELGIDDYAEKRKALCDLPSADRPQGEWKSVRASIYPYGYDVECSVCGHRMGSSFGYKFCPMCGCRMKGADDE